MQPRSLRACGADTVLVKPCLPDALLQEMRQILLARRSGTKSDAVEALPASGAQHTPRLQGLAERSPQPIPKASLSKAHHRRDTMSPPIPPPALLCPNCDHPLSYQRSHIGGVSEKHSEQWDYFECLTGCGQFQFRQRTRKLRRVS